MSTPEPITEEDSATVPLTPRLATKDPRNRLNPKVRLIDDFKAIGVNGLGSAVDTDIPDTLDAALSIASLYETLSPGVELGVFAVDFCHSYKNIPIAEDQRGYATIVLAPPSGPPMKATLRTQPCGARRAPANWARVAAFLRWVCAHFFGITLFVYVDDCFVAEPVDTVGSAFSAFRELVELFGLPLDVDKEKRPAAEIDLLGAMVHFSLGRLARLKRLR